jgi:hypothetical protein
MNYLPIFEDDDIMDTKIDDYPGNDVDDRKRKKLQDEEK